MVPKLQSIKERQDRRVLHKQDNEARDLAFTMQVSWVEETLMNACMAMNE